ncbi:MAG TPA: 50S ribosomal protein L17 [Saprospiraceae bacterium]|nr:50S ribosomal protein L17 [Saprospiraceae bacterium]
MRHGKKFNHLSRKKGHRSALLRNLAAALIKHKRIVTTLAKAKALRVYIEPLVTKSKVNSTHSRRTVFSYLQNKESIDELFGTIATKVGTRPGGYTRVIRMGFRRGDGAEMGLIELVDFNDSMVSASKAKAVQQGAKKKTRRSKAKTKGGQETEAGSEPVTTETENE